MKKIFVISFLILFSSLLIQNFSVDSMERRIVSNTFYTTTISKASEVLAFTIIPKDYLNQSKSGKRKLLMKKYDTEIYLEPLKETGDEYWISWSFDNKWYKAEGTCFTFREIRNDSNGNRLYSDANPYFQAVNEKGESIHGSWGGGGSTYIYGFNITKENFNKSKRIDVTLKNFNLMNYKLEI